MKLCDDNLELPFDYLMKTNPCCLPSDININLIVHKMDYWKYLYAAFFLQDSSSAPGSPHQRGVASVGHQSRVRPVEQHLHHPLVAQQRPRAALSTRPPPSPVLMPESGVVEEMATWNSVGVNALWCYATSGHGLASAVFCLAARKPCPIWSISRRGVAESPGQPRSCGAGWGLHIPFCPAAHSGRDQGSKPCKIHSTSYASVVGM